MAQSDTSPLAGTYIHNYTILGYPDTRIDDLIRGNKQCIINIYPENIVEPGKENTPYNEYNRRAGIGKSILLKQCLSIFHTWRKESGDKSYNVQYAEDIPIIDFSSTNFNTRFGILSNIIKTLLSIDSGLKIYFEKEMAGPWQEKNNYFPEILEDGNFEKLTTDLQKNYFSKRAHGIWFLFFDSFDEQYVGTKEESLYRWLTNILFPWLSNVMKVSIIIAGREKLETSAENSDLSELLKRVELNRFKTSQVYEYFEKYFKNENRLNPKHPYLLPDANDKLWKEITDLTDGKPIFVDFVCDLAKIDFYNSKFEKNLKESWKAMAVKAATPSEEQKAFKTHLINRLHLRNPKKPMKDLDDAEKNPYFRAEVIRILSVAKHGLTAEQFQWVRDDGVVDKEKVKEIKEYFNETFTDLLIEKGKKRQSLPYVKNRGDARLLHDEILELLQEYHWDWIEFGRKEYNSYLEKIIKLYEQKLLTHNDETRHSRLLEYIEYKFSFQDREQETAAINRYLFEFSLYLDNFPDLCSRLNSKARRYYYLKKADFDNRTKDVNLRAPIENSLCFDKDFPLLAKIPMRTVEYLLTERNTAGKDWDTFITRFIGEVKEYANHPYLNNSLTKDQTQAIEARILAAEGEMLIWKNEWEKGEAKILEAEKLFYCIGDSHSQDWCVHLLGFELQRRADFERAFIRHQAAIDSAIVSLNNLCDELKNKEVTSETFAKFDHLRLLVKVLSRAGSNTAINHRYRGRVVDGIKTLQTFRNMAKITGGREDLRLSINHKQLDALQWKTLDFQFEEKKVNLFQDALLERRLTFTKLVYELRQVGKEDRYYRMTVHEFDKEKPMLDNPLEPKISKAIHAFEEKFSPTPAPLARTSSPVRITQPYDDVKNKISASREIAELYYQFGGRVVLSTKYSPVKEKSYFDLARTAYDNALKVSKEAGFEFLILQTIESSCRLHYLVGNVSELNRCFDDFDKKQGDLIGKGYAPYYDLLSKYWLTKGDQALQVLDGQYLSKEGTPPAIVAYINMLYYAVQHNQFLYHLALEIFASRLKSLFHRMAKSEILSFKRKIMSVVESSDIVNKDTRFMNYIGWLLQAVTFHREPKPIVSEVLTDIKMGIRRLMQRGEFIKAGTINNFLIEYYSDQIGQPDEQTESNSDSEDTLTPEKKLLANLLASRMYQQVYIYQGAHKHSKVNLLIESMNAMSIKLDKRRSLFLSIHFAHDIAMAVYTYRTADFWNLERFILGEMDSFRKGKTSKKGMHLPFEEPKNLLENTIAHMSEHMSNFSKADQKLLAEALFRLGELYILRGETNGDFQKNFKSKLGLVEKFLSNNDLDKAEKRSFVKSRLSPAIYVLNLAYLYARQIGDSHRYADALQSIANALYFEGESRSPEGRARIVDKIKEKVIQKCKDERQEGVYRYPVVAAKMYLVEGDVYFSEVFEIPFSGGKTNLAVVRSEMQDSHTLKTLLHRMMWAYLSALNHLADPNKIYRNFHFDNMLLEINRRILMIPDQKIIKMLREGLRAAWNTFDELQSRMEALKSIETELAIHEVSLKVNEIYPPGIKKSTNHEDSA